MAQTLATATFTLYGYPKGIDNTQRFQVLRGTVKISAGGFYPPGGFPCSWGALSNSNGEPVLGFPVQAGGVNPTEVDFYSVSNGTTGGGFGPSGFVYAWDNVSNGGNGSLHVFVAENSASGNSGPLVELGGAIPASVVADTIQFTCYLPRD